MINALLIKKPHRTFKGKEIILFLPGVNLLVGDQGCGKSTILELITSLGGSKAFWKKLSKRDAQEVANIIVDKAAPVFAHDFENDSPRTSPSFETMGTIPLGLSISLMRQSHGQANTVICDQIAKMKDTYIILDEPDSGLSCRSALKLAASLKTAADNGCQIIASVHHPWLIEQFKMVFSVEEQKWISSSEFLASMREPTPEESK
jgi:predicted ATPase